MRNTVAGSGSATATLAGAKLSITGTFDGLKSPATSAKLNAGVARGVRGNAIGNLQVTNSTKGSITGCGRSHAGPGQRDCVTDIYI